MKNSNGEKGGGGYDNYNTVVSSKEFGSILDPRKENFRLLSPEPQFFSLCLFSLPGNLSCRQKLEGRAIFWKQSFFKECAGLRKLAQEWESGRGAAWQNVLLSPQAWGVPMVSALTGTSPKECWWSFTQVCVPLSLLQGGTWKKAGHREETVSLMQSHSNAFHVWRFD